MYPKNVEARLAGDKQHRSMIARKAVRYKYSAARFSETAHKRAASS
jgi:hypothetical protein